MSDMFWMFVLFGMPVITIVAILAHCRLVNNDHMYVADFLVLLLVSCTPAVNALIFLFVICDFLRIIWEKFQKWANETILFRSKKTRD